MESTQPTEDRYTLWGGPLSLYSGKVRSYLIKKGLPFREFFASHPEFTTRLRPIVRLSVTPVVETPAGDVLQDSTEIIDFLESSLPERSLTPKGALQRAVARLIDAYATEHLLLPAMHYRWGEPHVSVQRAFLDAEFGRVSCFGLSKADRDAAGARMRNYFCGVAQAVGVTPETGPAIEAAYLDLLDRLDEHFQHVPYLLGGRPCIADFGLMGPMYAHLGRDPVPANLMKLRAPNVARWIERMHLASLEDGEFPHVPTTFPEGDTLPLTLEPILQLIFRDWTPELQANWAAYQNWLSAHPDLPSGHAVNLDEKRRVHPTLGPIQYELRGVMVHRTSAPQALWHYDQFLMLSEALDDDVRKNFDALMDRVGGREAVSLRLPRRIVRRDYILLVE
ncbi:MAG TPA: glutathione S-transferase family protein [Aquabacterium sp.]|nr:glutathione S-transferase family protein [Aquabacterium sp.]